jgi:hypothetical protein
MSIKISIIIGALMLIFFMPVKAQTLAAIRDLWVANDLSAAKNDIDKLERETTLSVELLLLKANIYASISEDAMYKELVADAKTVCYKAIQSAVSVDFTKTNLYLKENNYEIVNRIKQGFVEEGIAYYNAGIDRKDTKDFTSALIQFKKAAAVVKLQIDNSWVPNVLDTNLIYYLCTSAINADKQQDAYINCKIIADNKINSLVGVKNIQSIYKWLVYYSRVNDFEEPLLKYTAIANSLFQSDTYYQLNIIEWYKLKKDWQNAILNYNKINLLNIDNKLITKDYLHLKCSLFFQNLLPQITNEAFEKELLGFASFFNDPAINIVLGKFYTNLAFNNSKKKSANYRSQTVKVLDKANSIFNEVLNNKKTSGVIFDETKQLLANNLFLVKQKQRAREVLAKKQNE